MQKIKGANMDIDFSKVEGMVWDPGKCPWGEDHKCAIKNVYLCDYFGGIEAPDTLICNYQTGGNK
jgi:hypothetical protein